MGIFWRQSRRGVAANAALPLRVRREGKFIQPAGPMIVAPLGSLLFLLVELNDYGRRLKATERQFVTSQGNIPLAMLAQVR